MKRILLAIIIILAIGGGVYYFATNNLAVNPDPDKIAKNNLTTNTTQKLDYTNITPHKLIVPNKYKKGAFSQEHILNYPEGFEVSVFLAGLEGPRQVAFDNSNGIYITDKKAGKLYFTEDLDNDSIADDLKTVDQNLKNVHGVEFYEGSLFVAEENQINVYKNISKDKYLTKETIVVGLPSGATLTGGGHTTRTVRIGPDKKMYVAIGSSCNLCEEDDIRRAAIVRYNLDGSSEEVFATGLRNTVDFIFDEDNKIWSVDNGRDLIGDDIPPEEVNIIQIGNNYGWPICYGDKIPNPEYSDKVSFCQDNTKSPVYELQAHSAPLGLTFSPWKDLNKNLLIAFHGSWNRTTPTGYKIIRIDTQDVRATPINFITGWLMDNGSSWGRPVDVKVYKNNQLLITDDSAGAVYLVKLRK